MILAFAVGVIVVFFILRGLVRMGHIQMCERCQGDGLLNFANGAFGGCPDCKGKGWIWR